MADKKQPEFVVSDRRRFVVDDGEVHQHTPDAPPPSEQKRVPEPARAPEPPRPQAAPPPQSQSRIVTPGAEEEHQPAPPPSAEEQQAGADAFRESSQQLDQQIKSQLGRDAKEFEMTFERFVASIYMSALMQLGLLREQGGQARVDLLGARQSIDTLAILREKTKGNLTPIEDNLLSNSLYELQMAYVEVTNALAQAVQPPPGGQASPFKK